MIRNDPYSPADSQYECQECGDRITTEEESYGTCPGCGGSMRNIAVPRE